MFVNASEQPLMVSELNQCMDYSQSNPEREVTQELILAVLSHQGKMIFKGDEAKKVSQNSQFK